jgi:hypothetical protein
VRRLCAPRGRVTDGTGCACCRRLRAGDLENVVHVLLRAFQTSLLQTYKSKFTQVPPACMPEAPPPLLLTSLTLAVFALLRVCARRDDARVHCALQSAGPLGSAYLRANRLLRRDRSNNAPPQTDKISDTAQPPILRIAAASYMASFLARASFLSPAFVLQHLASLSRWCVPANDDAAVCLRDR